MAAVMTITTTRYTNAEISTSVAPAQYEFSTFLCPTLSARPDGSVGSGSVIGPLGTTTVPDISNQQTLTITCQYPIVEIVTSSVTTIASPTTSSTPSISTTSTPSIPTTPTTSIPTTPTTSIPTTPTTSIPTTSTTSISTTSTATMSTRVSNQTSSWSSPTPSLLAETKSTQESRSQGLSAGVTAGIGVGLAILGLFLGAAAAWCILSRRRRRESESDFTNDKTLVTPMLYPGPPSKILSTPGGSSAGPLPMPVGGAKNELDLFLLDDTNDGEITSELTALGHLITDHVENNYHLYPVHEDPDTIRESLSGLGLDDRIRSQIATLSLDPRTRHIAIRSLLAHAIFSALDIRNSRGHSLLPAEVAAFTKSLPPGKSLEPGTPNAKALETWRRVSAFLLHENSQDRSPLPLPPSINSQIQNLQTALDGFLGYFVHDDSRARFDQSRNLDGVIRECAGLGYVIFSHPCEWRYSFAAESRNDIVVLPGLERLSKRVGETHDSPRVVAWPVAVTL